MVDQRLWELYNQAKRNFDSDRLMASKTIDEKLKTLQDIGQILLNQDIEDNSVRVKTFEYITPDNLKASLKETQQLIRPENDAYVDYFGKSYNRVRRFSGKFLATLKFQVRGSDSGLLTALNLVHEIHLGRRRKLPDDAPTEFVPEPWQPYVQSGQKIDRRYYELAALWLLRQQLRSGDIYLAQSRRFSELETYFIPPKEWSLCRDEVVNLTGTPIDANQGEIKTQQDDQLLNQVGCLNLVTNAIIVWNTVYINKVVQQLRLEGYSVDDEDLKYIWPTRHTHINIYGQYHFDKKRLRKKHPLRALRNPAS